MDHAPHGHQVELLDELERVLTERFGLRSALTQARELLADETLASAERLVQAATTAQGSVGEEGGSLVDALERARGDERDARSVVALLEGWRARERAEARLAVDVFVGASSLGPARDSSWRPGLERGAPDHTPVYLRDPQLRVCEHFEPEVDLLIYDPALATLAMVQVLDGRDAAVVRERVSRHVDRATYLRHLLLTARDEGAGHDRQIISVELVLVHDEQDRDGDGQVDLLHEVGQILRDLASQTDCLHAIGINVLAAGAQGFVPARVRRAFSWLLHDSRQWFEALEQRREGLEHEQGGAVQGFGRLRAIELDDYRLPGRRILSFDEGARLHLLHGHNGSGKSSLVEALELMITGSIERLSGIDDYEHVVRNRWASGPARVVLHGVEPEREPLAFELQGSDRPPCPLAPGSRASSFRLDQTVMDRLARASDVDRAAELLAAFFADEAQVRERWQQAMAEAEVALARLPARARRWLEDHRRERQDLHEVVVERLAGLADNRVEAELVDALLPISRERLRPLVGQLDALAQLELQLERDGYVPADAPLWDSLEAAFAELAGDLFERVGTLEAVLRTLDRVGRWWSEGDGAAFDGAGDYAAALDEWLELSALVEIVEQQERVLSALSGARAQGWDLARLDEAGAAAPLLRDLAEVSRAVREDLARVGDQWTKRGELLGRALRRSSDVHGSGTPLAAARARLDDEEVDELDRFGAWWAPKEQGPGLGARIRGAIERDETHSFATALIGAQSWVTPIRDAAANMLEPLRELQRALRMRARPETARSELGRDGTVVHAPAPLDVAREQFAAAAEEVAEGWFSDEAEDDEAEDEELVDGEAIEAEESEPSEEGDEVIAEVAVARSELPVPPGDRLYDLGSESPRPEQAEPETELQARGLPSRRRAASTPGLGSKSSSAPPAMATPAAMGGGPLEAPRQVVAQSKSVSLSPDLDAPSPPAFALESTPDSEPVSLNKAPNKPPSKTPSGRLGVELGLSLLIERLRQAYMVSVRAHEVGMEVQDSFVMRLAANDERALSLVDALNELMALFTPARWAYEDVVLRYEEAGQLSRLRFETGELRGGADPKARARANLRLNTAQLNAFTLALFLLCAPRVNNPIGLLVLDDPLQNMDELTVTTLARGLAKLVRVLPKRWSLMMLFHGEGDLARFHDEVECGVYFLPWLSPTVRGQELDIVCQDEDSRLGLMMQRLDDLVALQP